VAAPTNQRPFRKVLVANRGEIAVRIIRACRELRIPAVAVYSEADADALHVRMADEAICIGPPPNKESYLNIPNIVTAALVTECDAVHPGVGNLSEMAAFAENCEICKLTFIGPRAATIEAMQDKAEAKRIMRRAGVPVIPGSDSAVWNEQDAVDAARPLGYPLMIKATAGGGGRGIRIVQNNEDLVRQIKIAQREAEAAFGRPEVYLEKYLEEARHIEFQIMADQHGNVAHLGERDCSIQTGHQKLIEESPCAALTPGARGRMGDAAVKGARAVDYVNAGTVEFLVDREHNFYFLEMNTRLQVEHTVTEMVTSIDLVKEQMYVAAGAELSFRRRPIEQRGHAIECRVNAQDPDNHFSPSPGVLEAFIPPGGPGIRVDTHCHSGYRVPAFYDPLLAKVVAWGRDREEAIARARRAVDEFVVRGVKTTLPFHRRALANAFFRRGEVYLNFIRRRLADED
jgi:acetyl-CoA carboxylase biotin carboxylase subunit